MKWNEVDKQTTSMIHPEVARSRKTGKSSSYISPVKDSLASAAVSGRCFRRRFCFHV
jgi:hypothetical protein